MPKLDSPILKIKDYRILLSSRWLLTLALQFQSVIIGWQIYQIRKEALLLGLIGLAEALPAITGSFFAGHLVDISKPAKIFRVSLWLSAINSCYVILAVMPGLNLSDQQRLFILFSTIFVSGAVRSFTSPSHFALVPAIVDRNLLSTAAAFNSSTFTFAQIIGPALGGLIYGFYGPLFAFSVPAVLTIGAAFLPQGFSAKTKTHKAINLNREPMFKSIHAGLKFVTGHRVLISTMVLDMFSVLFGGAVAVLPIFADQVFAVGSSGLGILRAAPALGSVVVSAFFALRPMRRISGAVLMIVIVGFGLTMILFGISTNFYVALFFLALSGFFDGINMIIRGTITQLLTPEHMRGRVSALGSIFITSSNEIGALESGIAAQAMGLIPSVIFGGIMTLVVVACVFFTVPELKKTRIDS